VEIDFAEVGALVSQLHDPQLDVSAVRRQVDEMAQAIHAELPVNCGHRCKIQALNHYLFIQHSFRPIADPDGLYADAEYDRIDRVIANHAGYCEGLSVLYLALGQRLGVPLSGVRRRQHLYVRYTGSEDGPIDIDPTRAGHLPSTPDVLGCRAAEGVYGQTLDARAVVGEVISQVAILAGVSGKLAWLDMAAEFSPNNPDLHNNRGVQRESVYDAEGALTDYRTAIRLDPCATLYHSNLVGLLARLGRHAEARRAMNSLQQQVSREGSPRSRVLVALAAARLELEAGNDAAAEPFLRQAQGTMSSSPMVFDAVGRVRMAQGRFADARLAFEMASRVGRSPGISLRLAGASIAVQDFAAAELALQQATTERLPRLDITLLRAEADVGSGRVTSAVEYAQACLTEAGLACSTALVVLGDAMHMQGSMSCAQRYYEAYLACPFPWRDRSRRTRDALVRERLQVLRLHANVR